LGVVVQFCEVPTPLVKEAQPVGGTTPASKSSGSCAKAVKLTKEMKNSNNFFIMLIFCYGLINLSKLTI
jgi:hypothetical protein